MENQSVNSDEIYDATTPSADMPYSQRVRSIPWRIIPVAILYLYGGLVVLVSTVWVYMVFGGCAVIVNHTHYPSDSQIYVLMFGMILFGVHGCFVIAAGRYLWKRWWRGSILAFVGAIILLVLAYLPHCIVDRMPPGEEWPPPYCIKASAPFNNNPQPQINLPAGSNSGSPVE